MANASNCAFTLFHLDSTLYFLEQIYKISDFLVQRKSYAFVCNNRLDLIPNTFFNLVKKHFIYKHNECTCI